MNGTLLLLYAAPGVPLALTALLAIPPLRRLLPPLLPVAPLPALLAALLLPAGTAAPISPVLLGAGLMLDDLGRIFLGVAALLWSLAGLYAFQTVTDEGRQRFAGFWLATLSGNLLLFVAADAVTFYLAFTALSLAAYGLVAHEGTAEARRAALIYLVLAVLGETCLLLGVLIAVDAADSLWIDELRSAIAASPHRHLAIGLLLAGFGMKAGLMPLHVWLPLAHPAAPVPASAVLSGAIVKAGIFGLARFLPLGADLPGWSMALVVLGLVTAYGGILFGVVQQRPKTVLAYSTLSQMGLVIAVLGVGLRAAGPWPVLAAVALYAVHHGLAKGALFLSVGVFAKAGTGGRGPLFLATTLAALAVAGLPLTGGALAKLAIKGPMEDEPAMLWITISAAGTTLLMLRFLQLLRRQPPALSAPRAGLLLPFLLCLAAAFALPWLLFPALTGHAIEYPAERANIWAALWPVLTGAALAAGALRMGRVPIRIPEGDVLVPIEKGWRQTTAALRRLDLTRFPAPRPPLMPAHLQAAIDGTERALSRWSVAAPILLLAVLLIAGFGLL